MLNKRTRKVEETFNLTFDDYYLKQTDSKFENKSILVDSDTQIENFDINDFDYDLIFEIPNRAIDAEVHAPDNQTSESSKHTDDSTITTKSISCESVPEVCMEGEHTTTDVQGEQTFEGENETMNHQIKGEHSQFQQEHHFEG